MGQGRDGVLAHAAKEIRCQPGTRPGDPRHPTRTRAGSGSARRPCPIDRSYFGAIERGEFNITLDTIAKIAAALGISASHLLARAGL
jgi:transcriptional regulator with XRE-family HTH domain